MGLLDFVRQQDLFGVPVQLTYKGQRRFKSIIGGCLSIMFVVAALVIFIVYSLNFYREP